MKNIYIDILTNRYLCDHRVYQERYTRKQWLPQVGDTVDQGWEEDLFLIVFRVIHFNYYLIFII